MMGAPHPPPAINNTLSSTRANEDAVKSVTIT